MDIRASGVVGEVSFIEPRGFKAPRFQCWQSHAIMNQHWACFYINSIQLWTGLHKPARRPLGALVKSWNHLTCSHVHQQLSMLNWSKLGFGLGDNAVFASGIFRISKRGGQMFAGHCVTKFTWWQMSSSYLWDQTKFSRIFLLGKKNYLAT